MARQKNIRRSKRNTSRMSKGDNDGLELFEHLGGKTSVRQKRKIQIYLTSILLMQFEKEFDDNYIPTILKDSSKKGIS